MIPSKPRKSRVGARRSFKEKHPEQIPQCGTAANDCQRLIEEYIEKQTVRFEEFVKLWKTGGYSLLQCAVDQRFRSELVEFMMGQFIIQLRSDNVLNCVASIYALYCTYTSQTCQPIVRIRLTTHLYQRIKQVHDWATADEHSDLDFIIRQLGWKNALDIVYYSSELLIGTGKTCLEGGDPLDEFLQSKPTSHMPGVLTQAGVTELDELMEEYKQAKQSLSGGDSILEPLNYLQPCVAGELQSLSTKVRATADKDSSSSSKQEKD
ncbi:snRNA-activating protein complex subunit 1-like [Sycon ciliatum]|uniref:snRNA-activating protein complex subunit 1-like n=1 Tax=Sycon ciliatum TaxID=27933 RepID=UPI0020ADFCF5|eukprot:scpid91988/ scgid28601/ snRNA-activating protein complex subunit 1; Proximal sequence element-binding transcription factor subunit gamma; Small nuclear RNA-activating complex polypeptide 1; snRNA-activating protein complex 43 kDa subunit